MQPLVNVDWLLANRDSVIVLDTSVTRIDRGAGVTDFAPGPEGFAAGHIPGALFADLMGAFSDTASPFHFTAPPLAQFGEAARALGINQDSRVVIYDALGGAYAARLRLMLRHAGLDDVAVLDGGLAAWKAAGQPLETGMPAAVARGNFDPAPIDDLFVSTAEVQSLSAAPVAKVPLICALRAVQFEAGHIPASHNIPYPAILDESGMIDPSRLRAALDALGFDDEITPVLYCGGGINAAGLALGLELLGLTDIAIYDDSMAGWRAAGLPLETGPADV